MKLAPRTQPIDPIAVVITVASLIMTACLMVHYALHPSVLADAKTYQEYALRFRAGGVLSDFGSIRTYGYPLFLWTLSFLSGTAHPTLAVTAGVCQYFLFLASTIWLSRLVAPYGRMVSLAVLIGLLLNPVVLAHVTDALSEGLSIPLTVFMVGLTVCANNARNVRQVGIVFAIFAVVSNFALMVRPANFTLTIGWIVTCAIAVIARSEWRGKRLVLAGTFVLASVPAAGIVLGPQLYYNFVNWRELSVFPVCNLGDLQLGYGIVAWKYDTYVTGGVPSRWFYLNPLFTGAIPAHFPIHWYAQHPGNGLATAFAHIVASFSITSIFTYISDPTSKYRACLVFSYWLLAALGSVQGVPTGAHLQPVQS